MIVVGLKPRYVWYVDLRRGGAAASTLVFRNDAARNAITLAAVKKMSAMQWDDQREGSAGLSTVPAAPGHVGRSPVERVN